MSQLSLYRLHFPAHYYYWKYYCYCYDDVGLCVFVRWLYRWSSSYPAASGWHLKFVRQQLNFLVFSQGRDWQLTLDFRSKRSFVRKFVWTRVSLSSLSLSLPLSLSGRGRLRAVLPATLEMAVSIKYHFQFPCFMIPPLLSTNNPGPPTLSWRWLITLVSPYIETFTWK